MTPDRKTYSKRFLTLFAVFSLTALVGIGLIGYIVDPFFQFRARTDATYFLNPRFVNGGLARNYDYNTVVMGSSMVQNYNLSILRDNDPLVKPVKLSTGGMNILEMEYLYTFIDKGKTNSIIINLDIPQFNGIFDEIRYPDYLYEDGVFNNLKYLYSYETFVRYIPIDVGLTIYLKDKEHMTPKYHMKTSIEDIGNNSLDTEFGAEYVKSLYLRGQTVSGQALDSIPERMQRRLDSLLQRLEVGKHPTINYTFVMPPYSALYWHHALKNGYYKGFRNFTYYICKSMEKYKNVKVAFFLDIDEITDLNHYSDITHFDTVLSDKILNNINNPDYLLNSSNIDNRMLRLDSLVEKFAEENKEWLH